LNLFRHTSKNWSRCLRKNNIDHIYLLAS
jgi:hypothetical protein